MLFWKKARALTNTVFLTRKYTVHFIYLLGTPMIFLDEERKHSGRAGRVRCFLWRDGQKKY